MYLETILKIRKRKGSVRSIEIAEELGFSKPSVSRAVGIMKKDGFIVVHTDGIIELTDAGRVKAENIFARHKSLTEALVKMGFSQKAAEENACRIEHVITEEAFLAIKSISTFKKRAFLTCFGRFFDSRINILPYFSVIGASLFFKLL